MSHVLIAALSCIGLTLVTLVLLRSENTDKGTSTSTRTGTNDSAGHLPTWSASLLQTFDSSELVEAPRQPRPEQPTTPLLPGGEHFPDNRLAREGRNLVLEIEEFLAQQSH